jgi:hypothetical protein
MLLDTCLSGDDQAPHISAAQGSAFAKDIAGDFNPIHDADSPRFCVPGDLLFALVLTKTGLSSRMEFLFTGMVGADVPLRLDISADQVTVRDQAGKPCLSVSRAGPSTQDPELIESLIRCYVAFSGHNFPHFLVPLMERHGVMINPDRPLVIYERMSFELSRLDRPADGIQLTDSTLDISGRRGDVRLRFDLTARGERIGEGAKKLVLSGLRPLEQAALDGLVARYHGWAAAYREQERG